MISQPVVSLTFDEGSGINTDNHGTAGGTFVMMGAWSSAGSASAASGPYLTPSATNYALAPISFSYANDGNWTAAVLMRASALSQSDQVTIYAHGTPTASGSGLIAPTLAGLAGSGFRGGLQVNVGLHATGANSSLGNSMPADEWVLFAIQASNYVYTPVVVTAAGATAAAPISLSILGSTAMPNLPGAPRLRLGGWGTSPTADSLSPFRGGLDSFSLHDATLGIPALQQLYWAALRGLTLAQAQTVVNINAASSMTGSTGSDALDALATAATLSGLAGDDLLLGSAHADQLLGGTGNDTLQGGGGDDSLDGGADADTASYAHAEAGVLVDLQAQGQGQNTQGAGTDTLLNIEHLQGSGFNDTLGGDTGRNMLQGGAGHDALFGGTGNDTLLGEAGDDSLYGGEGADVMQGGTGHDAYVIDDAGDVVIETANQGIDTAYIGLDAQTLPDHVEHGILTVQGFSRGLTGNGLGNILVASFGFGNRLDGGAGDDWLIGQGFSQDTLLGGEGNDTLDGRAGTGDALQGGAGNDTYLVRVDGDTVTEAANGGFDIVFAFANAWEAPEHVEVVYAVTTGLLGGSGMADILVARPGGGILRGNGGDDALWGREGDDSLDGGGGHDTLRGGAGNDTLVGGDGDDVVLIEDAGDVFRDAVGSGTDTAWVMVDNWASNAALGIDVIRLAGTATMAAITGGSSVGVLVAHATLGSSLTTARAAELWGQDGHDSLTGSSNADTLRGGAGQDLLTGGAGDDLMVGGTGADVFRIDATGSGHDTIFDFARAEGDQLRFTAASGISGFGQLAITEIGGNAVISFGSARIDLYGVAGLTAGDFIFG